jgi:hypothetical protein
LFYLVAKPTCDKSAADRDTTPAANYAAVATRLRKLAAEAHSSEAQQDLYRLASMYETLASHPISPATADSNL